MGDATPWVVGAIVLALYLFSVWAAAKSPDLPPDIDIDAPASARDLAGGQGGPALRAADRHADLVPDGRGDVAVALRVLGDRHADRADGDAAAADRFLPRHPDATRAWTSGLDDVLQGFNDGSRNMIGIGVATATAGVIVGAITLTGLGLRMTEFVEFVSQGNVIAMLLFIAFVCLVLGLGVPTTANYVLVATLMAPVVVELGAQSGLVIPLIAVHLFVFYYGIMGDITPPVGLATFAAAAISGENAIATGIQGSLYALRTVILPFIWIFNPQLLLIDIDSIAELVSVIVASTLAMLDLRRGDDELVPDPHRLWETLLLAAACVLLFRPGLLHGLPRARVHASAGREGGGGREEPARRRAPRDGDQGHDDRGRRRHARRWPCGWAPPATTAASASRKPG